jgi:hypothetical protein
MHRQSRSRAISNSTGPAEDWTKPTPAAHGQATVPRSNAARQSTMSRASSRWRPSRNASFRQYRFVTAKYSGATGGLSTSAEVRANSTSFGTFGSAASWRLSLVDKPPVAP